MSLLSSMERGIVAGLTALLGDGKRSLNPDPILMLIRLVSNNHTSKELTNQIGYIKAMLTVLQNLFTFQVPMVISRGHLVRLVVLVAHST